MSPAVQRPLKTLSLSESEISTLRCDVSRPTEADVTRLIYIACSHLPLLPHFLRFQSLHVIFDWPARYLTSEGPPIFRRLVDGVDRHDLPFRSLP